MYKLTLLDYPEHIACSIFTAGCNFCCPFCHNAPLVTCPDPHDRILDQDVLDFLKSRTSILEGVCISGGEPTLCPDLIEFIQQIKAMGYLVKLDTNGSNPVVLQTLLEQHLIDYVAMDIKNSKEKYSQTIGLTDYDCANIMASIHLCMTQSPDYEFRTTVVKELHTLEDFYKIADMIQGCKRYFLQSFVDSGHVIKDGFHSYSTDEMKDLLTKLRPIIPNVSLRGIQ